MLRAASIFSAGARPPYGVASVGAGRAVFGPVRLRLERGPTLAAAFHFIPVFDDFGVQGSVQWEDGCLKPPAQQRIGNALYANTFLAIVQ